MNTSKAEENIRVVHMGLTMSRSIKKELKYCRNEGFSAEINVVISSA
jgi:hypothetical protein